MADTIVIAILALLFVGAIGIVVKLDDKLVEERSNSKSLQCTIKTLEESLKKEILIKNTLRHRLEALQEDYNRLSYEYRELESKTFTIDADNLKV